MVVISPRFWEGRKSRIERFIIIIYIFFFAKKYISLIIIYMVVHSEKALSKNSVNAHDNGICENSIYASTKPSGEPKTDSEVSTNVSYLHILLLTTHYLNSIGLQLHSALNPAQYTVCLSPSMWGLDVEMVLTELLIKSIIHLFSLLLDL